jgi:DNA-binding transcriptional ArsR family regulator
MTQINIQGRAAKQATKHSSSSNTEEMMEQARAASELLKALSHETRLVILCLLSEGEKSVSELEKLLNLRQPAISQQLARLRADDLVDTRRNGKNVYYSLARPEAREIIEALYRTFCKSRSGMTSRR